MSTTAEKWTIFGERLKAELERQGMSLRQFADKTGITLTTACRYVHSQRTPRATEILKAAKALGTTCDYMLGLSDDPHKTRDGWTKGAPLHDSGTDYAHGFADGYKQGLKDAESERVRCKDCKYWNDEFAKDKSTCWLPCMSMTTHRKWYCGSAERRTDE